MLLRSLPTLGVFFLTGLPAPIAAAIIWAAGAPGVSTLTFAKPAFADPAAANDPISPIVALARADDRGLYNLAAEAAYVDDLSPAGTEWAFAGLDGNPATIGAADFAILNFSDWRNALGGRFALLGNIENRPGVLHLIEEDIYLDITFTAWGGPSSGGHFTYTRTAPIPEPVWGALLCGSLPLLFRRRRPPR
jgi:hypothetical protein